MTAVESVNRRVPLFGFEIDAIDMPEAVERIYGWIADDSPCRYVVTPNVEHAVLYQRHAGFRSAYADAALVLADGMPVVAAARLMGRYLPGRVTGSDLAPALFDAAAEHGGCRVYLLGAAAGVAERAAAAIATRWPAVRVAGTYSPPLGFECDPLENEKILSNIAVAMPDVLVVGLGAPKQELWTHEHQARIRANAALCIGATIDFLAGERQRAPLWMRRCGLEWLHRAASEPKRLAGRYAVGAFIFPRLVWREWTAATLARAARGVSGPG